MTRVKRPPRKIVKRRPVFKPKRPLSKPQGGIIPQAHATASTPPGWAPPPPPKRDPPTQAELMKKKGHWHHKQSGDLGRAIERSKAQNPEAWQKATGGTLNPFMMGVRERVQNMKIQQVGYTKKGSVGSSAKKRKGPVTYATTATGDTFVIPGKLGLHARQYYASKGIQTSSRKPTSVRQQELSDQFGITTFTTLGGVATTPSLKRQQQDLSNKFGITTYTKTGEVSTSPRNMAKKAQQALSDKYGITTYNKDGSVSTVPSTPGLQRAATD